MSSNAIMQSHASSKASALIKAMDTWKTPFDLRPQGVFGTVAIVRTETVTLNSDTLDIEYTVPFDDDLEPNEAEIVVYNLSDNTIEQLQYGMEISIESGYKGDTGVIFKGFITKVKTTHEDSDKVTTIKAMDDIKDHSIESQSFAAGSKASTILKALIDKTGIPVAVFEPARDHTYKDSQTVDGDLMQNIGKYAEVCGISVYVSKGEIYARTLKEGDDLNFEVSVDTGLIGSPSPYEEENVAEDYNDTVHGYEVEMLLQHRMSAGAIVKLTSKRANGTYRVCSGEHRFSIYEAVTTAKMY